MRNRLRVLGFDILAPLATIAALLMIGLILGWPRWWVAVCAMLCLLIVQAMIVNAVLFRRDSVTMGTDDDAPGLRLAVVGIATAALVAAALFGYTRWTLPDRDFTRDTTETVRIAAEVAEATATFSPSDPASAIDRATARMVPERAEAFKAQFGPAAADLAKRKVTAQAQTISAGLEALSPAAASVAVILRGTQTEPGQQPSVAVLSLRVAMDKRDGTWRVVDVTPVNSR
ncbi:hypothetical protein [Mycolicibacterium sp.]|uniref:hypothetical protein n=1 Tax=Mycolicibacterium sp. TaxID=2320850 RepID=UPI0028AFBDD3|nr:hypothetical protein [Mycolicibacterium sp.]